MPGRLSPLPVAKRSLLMRTSCSLRPFLCAAAAISGISPSRICRPEATSSPASRASGTMITPLVGEHATALTTPITMVLTPSRQLRAGPCRAASPSALQPGESHLADATIPGASRRSPSPVVGGERIAGIAQEEKVWMFDLHGFPALFLSPPTEDGAFVQLSKTARNRARRKPCGEENSTRRRWCLRPAHSRRSATSSIWWLRPCAGSGWRAWRRGAARSHAN